MKTLFYFIATVLQFNVSPFQTQAQQFEPDPGLFVQKPQITRYDSSYYFTSQGDELFYRKWGKLNNHETNKVLLIIHGIGYHSLPFRKIMNYTDTCNILVYAMDLRGHGLSGKTKGLLESNEQVMTDMDNMINIIKNENPNAKLYLLGTSMGGLYVLGYALSRLNNISLSGLILIAPALKVHRSQILQISNLEVMWLLMFDQTKPGIYIDHKKLEMSSVNPKWIQSRKSDSLALHFVSVDYLQEIRKLQKIVKRKSEISLLTIPVFIQHGQKDRIVDIKGSYYLENSLINADTELTVYPKSYHSLFWEKDSNLIFNDIVSWIMEN